MTEQERTGIRSLDYSRWHRTESTRRFLGGRARELTAIDIDFLEYCPICSRPLALVETAFDVGQYKASIVTQILAEQAGIPAFLLFYTLDESKDCVSFRVRKIAPIRGAEVRMTPAEWAELLLSLRTACPCRALAKVVP